MLSFDQALTEPELVELERYLGSDALPETCMDLEMLDGFFTALVVGPELVTPSEWLPLALGFVGEGETEPRFRDEREGERIIELVNRYYNGIAFVVQEAPEQYNPLFYENEDEDDESEESMPIGLLWAEGFLAGVALRQDGWQPLVDDEEASALTMPILALAAPDDDPELGTLAGNEEARRRMLELVPEAVIGIRDYWREEKPGRVRGEA